MRRIAPWPAAAALVVGACALAGCSGSGSATPTIPTIAPARIFQLTNFTPATAPQPGKPTTVSFTIQQPSGRPLTKFRRGPGPHTGVHLIIVRSDLSTIIHRHPPIGADGRISEQVTFPKPGRYRVVVDADPARGPLPNFQLFHPLTVAGHAKTVKLPPFQAVQVVDGYRFVMHGQPKLKAIQAAFLVITVTDPNGKPAHFEPWFGALAHAIFFRQGSLDYFHTHVCGASAVGCASILGAARVTGSSVRPGKLRVGVLVPLPGTWKLFLQCRVQGNVLTVPYTLKVT
jgi:hypothetical protein